MKTRHVLLEIHDLAWDRHKKSRQDHEKKKYNIVHHLFGDSLITILKPYILPVKWQGKLR